jgi:hypothetical protein
MAGGDCVRQGWCTEARFQQGAVAYGRSACVRACVLTKVAIRRCRVEASQAGNSGCRDLCACVWVANHSRCICMHACVRSIPIKVARAIQAASIIARCPVAMLPRCQNVYIASLCRPNVYIASLCRPNVYIASLCRPNVYIASLCRPNVYIASLCRPKPLKHC